MSQLKIYDSQDGFQDFANIFKQNDRYKAYAVLQSLGGDKLVQNLLSNRQLENQKFNQQRDMKSKYGPNFQGFQEPSLIVLLKSNLNYKQIWLIIFGIILEIFYIYYDNNIQASQMQIFIYFRYIFLSYIIISLIVTLIVQYYNQKRQVDEMNRENYLTIKTLNSEEQEEIKYYKDLMVGDIIILEDNWQIINVDGLLLEGDISADEGLITGDGYRQTKSPYELKKDIYYYNPFIYSGSKIVEGKAQLLVLTTGLNTQYFKKKLNRYLTQNVSTEQLYINKISTIFNIFGIIAMVSIFSLELNQNLGNIKENSIFEILKIFIITQSINLTVFPISLQIIVGLIQYNIVQQLKSLNITVHSENSINQIQNIDHIISDYQGIFIEKHLKVSCVHIGGIKIQKAKQLQQVSDLLRNHFLKCCLYTTISINKQEFFFEIALMKFISKLISSQVVQRNQDNIIKQSHEYYENKYNATIIKINNQYILYEIGRFSTVLPHCQKLEINDTYETESNLIIMAFKILSGIEETKKDINELLTELNLIAIIEFQSPLIPNFENVIKEIRDRNLQLTIVSNHNLQTMKQFLQKSQLDYPDSSIISGEDLRMKTGGVIRDGDKFILKNYDEFLKIIHNVRIVAEAKYSDKFILNTGLQQMGQNVAIITNQYDIPHLRLANIGILLNENIQAQFEQPDIQIYSNDINSVLKIFKWCSLLTNNTRMLIQFQIPATFASTVGILVIYYITVQQQMIFFNQIIWINVVNNGLITFSIYSQPPDEKFGEKFFITPEMTKHIILSIILQLGIIISLIFISDNLLFLEDGLYNFTIQRITIVYQTLILLQIFASISVKFNLNKKVNNPQFIIFILLELVAQYTMILIYPEYFDLSFLTLSQHLVCLVIGVSYLCMMGLICLVIPTKWFRIIPRMLQANQIQNQQQLNKHQSIEMSQSLKQQLLS